MKFSELYGVWRTREDEWFDPVLSVDTRLFIDPFLIYSKEGTCFRGSHSEIIAFFNQMFRLIAECRGARESLRYQKAVGDLVFPEVQELCLGYTEAGTGGLGSGGDSARLIADAIWEAIRSGLKKLRHFEEITILREGMGADRISDMTAGILRRRFASYTSAICRRHNVPTETVHYRRGSYDRRSQLWVPLDAQLPINPYNRKPILLVPRRYLRDLPTINADDFWDYCWVNENELLRHEFNYDISRRVAKHDIIELARRHPEVRRAYLDRVERRRPQPYDMRKDRKGLVGWYDAAKAYCQHHTLALSVGSAEAFTRAVERMVGEFSHFVEENSGWRLLWNDNGTSRSEAAAQLLLLGIVKHYCKANDIDISRESDIGRGPVDFKVAAGHQLRALLELKLARNSRFWDGLKKQVPAYLGAEGIQDGYFIVIAYNDSDLKKVSGLKAIARKAAKGLSYRIRTVVVDATADKLSASRL